MNENKRWQFDEKFEAQFSDGLLQVFLIVSDLLLVPPPKDQVSRKPSYSNCGSCLRSIDRLKTKAIRKTKFSKLFYLPD